YRSRTSLLPELSGRPRNVGGVLAVLGMDAGAAAPANDLDTGHAAASHGALPVARSFHAWLGCTVCWRGRAYPGHKLSGEGGRWQRRSRLGFHRRALCRSLSTNGASLSRSKRRCAPVTGGLPAPCARPTRGCIT